jgi:hypothetical protein
VTFRINDGTIKTTAARRAPFVIDAMVSRLIAADGIGECAWRC